MSPTTLATRGQSVRALLSAFEEKTPAIVFEWSDAETDARGWIVINSLRGGAAGGGTRMRSGLDRREVVSLAKTMEVKFTVSGPPIGGAKSGIDFDPADPRRDEVLSRWFQAVAPLLEAYYGTGGDLNVDELADVIPMTERLGLWHPQQGVVTGHYAPTPSDRVQKVGQLRVGVAKIVEDPTFTPDAARRYTIADLITGWGVAESVRHHYALWGGALAGKRVIVQGWGNVGSAAAYYLAKEGARIVGILDRADGLVATEGLAFEDVHRLFLDKHRATLVSDRMIPFDQANATIWDVGAEIFLPCAASRLVRRDEIDRMIAGGLEVISCGANVPFDNPEIFYGPITEYADRRVGLIPDFIANCGMARVFAYLMGKDIELTDKAIFGDVSRTIRQALQDCRRRSDAGTFLTADALEIALEQLVADPAAC